MEETRRQRIMNNPTFRLMRWTVPWLLLAYVAYRIWQISAGFGGADALLGSSTSASAVPVAVTEITTGTPVTGMSGVTLVKGIHLRDAPSLSGSVVTDLDKGVAFTVTERRVQWYRIKDGTGNIGWVYIDPGTISVKAVAKTDK